MEIVQQNENQLSTLSDERITAEILIYKDQVGYGMIELGKRLIEMKKRLGHGEWLPFLKGKVEFSEETARKFMKIAESFPNPKSTWNLGTEKIYALLDIPEEKREEFVSTPHQVETKNGTIEKTVDEMTVKEMKRVIEEKYKAELAEKQTEIERLKQDNIAFNRRIGQEKESKDFLQTQLSKAEIELKKAQNAKPEPIIKTEIVHEESPELQKAYYEAQQKVDELSQNMANAQKKIAELKALEGKKDEIEKIHSKIDKLKEEQNKYYKNLNSLDKVYNFITRTKAFIKDEMLHIPTLTLPPNNNSEVFLNDIALICDTLENFSYAIKNQFINKTKRV